jgi:hypothetical protein
MRTSSLIRYSGAAAIAGGALWIAKILYESNDATPYAKDITDYAFFVVPLLLLAGLTGLYALDVERSGRRDQGTLAGFFSASLGLVAISMWFGLWSLGIVSDALWGVWLGLAPLMLGLTIMGSSSIDSGALGRARALPLILGLLTILALIVPPWNVVGVVVWALLGGGWILLGIAIWTSASERIVQPA